MVSIVIGLLLAPTLREIGRTKVSYVVLAITQTINEYDKNHGTQSTIFTYQLFDYGFYNVLGQTPTVKYFAKNLFTESAYPEMWQAWRSYLSERKTDFVITFASTWQNEQAFIAQYYEPYTGDLATSTYHYAHLQYFRYQDLDFVLLIKKTS